LQTQSSPILPPSVHSLPLPPFSFSPLPSLSLFPSPLFFSGFLFPSFLPPSSLLPLSSPEVKLYLMVLEKLSKTEKRLEVIRGELGSSLCLITRRDHIMCRITAQTALMKFQSSENTLWTPGWKWTSYNYYMYVDHLGISIGRFC